MTNWRSAVGQTKKRIDKSRGVDYLEVLLCAQARGVQWRHAEGWPDVATCSAGGKERGQHSTHTQQTTNLLASDSQQKYRPTTFHYYIDIKRK